MPKSLAGSYTVQSVTYNGSGIDIKNNDILHDPEMSISEDNVMYFSYTTFDRTEGTEFPFTVSNEKLAFESDEWDEATGEFKNGLLTVTLIRNENEMQIVCKKDKN